MREMRLILRALDYFQAANAPHDGRLAEAIDIVRSRQRADGRWSLENVYKGKDFTLERLGAPSRWNTLRARRVLRWWEQARGKREAGNRSSPSRPDASGLPPAVFGQCVASRESRASCAELPAMRFTDGPG